MVMTCHPQPPTNRLPNISKPISQTKTEQATSNAPVKPSIRLNTTTGVTSHRKGSATQPSATAKPTQKEDSDLDVSGKKFVDTTKPNKQNERAQSDESDEDFFEERMLKPLPENLFFGDMRELADSIQREIIVANPMVFWEDIAGLTTAKQMVKEAVVMPLKYPQFFTGIITPWKGALLFGPPGTGKVS